MLELEDKLYIDTRNELMHAMQIHDELMRLIRQYERYEQKERKKNSEEYIDTALYYTRLYV